MLPRKGSRKGKVYDHYVEHGADAAVTFGQTLGAKPGKIKAWIREWSSGPTKTGSQRSRVRSKERPERLGTIVMEGPDQSEVIWDDGHRREECWPNSLLEKVETGE